MNIDRKIVATPQPSRPCGIMTGILLINTSPTGKHPTTPTCPLSMMVSGVRTCTYRRAFIRSQVMAAVFMMGLDSGTRCRMDWMVVL